jgi:hypothetical protein
MSSEKIQAIDVHAHFGRYFAPPLIKGAGGIGKSELVNKFMSADADVVVQRARLAHTRLTIVSPLEALLPRLSGDPVSGNVNAAQVVAETDGLLQWVVVDPTRPQTYEQAEQMLKQPKCVGIKIHPEEHGYLITEP